MGKIIRINEKELHRIIESCVRDVITLVTEENDNLSGELTMQSDPSPSSMELHILSTKEEREPWNESMWEMLQKSYNQHGGLKSYKNYEDFIGKRHSAIIVISHNIELLACATYRQIEKSFKMTAIGCLQNETGKLALQEIIKHNVINLDLHYWAEVSGAIEHYFKVHNGYPMPNMLASEILGIPEENIKLSKEDNIHYERIIANNGWHTKMIFGIKDEETYQRAVELLDDYTKFMDEVNKRVNESNNSSGDYTLKEVMYIIDNIITCNEDYGFNEMLPTWHEALLKCLKILNNIENKEPYIESYIESAEYLLKTMPVFTIHKLKM